MYKYASYVQICKTALQAISHKKYGKMLKNARKWLKNNKKGFEIVIFASLFQSLNLAQKERFELFFSFRVSTD
jgi:hypothetical protein